MDRKIPLPCTYPVHIAVGSCMNKMVSVTVTVDETSITIIEAVESNDSSLGCDAAINQLPKRIINTQSLAVDFVSGAILTSAGIFSAVVDCITQDGGNPSDFSTLDENRQKMI